MKVRAIDCSRCGEVCTVSVYDVVDFGEKMGVYCSIVDIGFILCVRRLVFGRRSNCLINE